MLHYIKLTICMCVVALFCQSCQSSNSYQDTKQWMESEGKLKVLCTIGMIEDLVKQIGGDHIDTLTLIAGDMNPHSYQLVKGDDEKLAIADVIFYNGLGLEHGPSLQSFLYRSEKSISLGNRIEETDPSLIIRVNGQTDPHIWMDISLWQRIVPHIVKTLVDFDPEHAEEFAENANKLFIAMQKEHTKVKKTMLTVPQEKRYLVTSHDAFNYFSRAYLVVDGEDDWDIRCTAPEGLAPESQLSTTDIQEIIDHVAKYHIKVIFPESNVSKDSIRKIVSAGREKGLELRIADMVLYADAMGPKGSEGDTYLKMVRHNSTLLAKCLLEN